MRGGEVKPLPELEGKGRRYGDEFHLLPIGEEKQGGGDSRKLLVLRMLVRERWRSVGGLELGLFGSCSRAMAVEDVGGGAWRGEGGRSGDGDDALARRTGRWSF